MASYHREWINEHLNPIVEPMLSAAIKQKPEDPIFFMINFLLEKKGYNQSIQEILNELKAFKKQINTNINIINSDSNNDGMISNSSSEAGEDN